YYGNTQISCACPTKLRFVRSRQVLFVGAKHGLPAKLRHRSFCLPGEGCSYWSMIVGPDLRRGISFRPMGLRGRRHQIRSAATRFLPGSRRSGAVQSPMSQLGVNSKLMFSDGGVSWRVRRSRCAHAHSFPNPIMQATKATMETEPFNHL